jgi:hypothetical protein
MSMTPNRNDVQDYEDWAFPVKRPEPDPDRDRDDFDWSELTADLQKQRRLEIAVNATPEQFRKLWSKL